MVLRVASMVVVAGACCAIAPSSSSAAAIAVSSTSDAVALDGQCSLREAITAANTDIGSGTPGECAAGAGADTIALAAGHYVLTRSGPSDDSNASGDLDLLGTTVSIAGAGASSTVIDGGGIDRVLDIITGRTVTLSGVTITGGKAPAGSDGFNNVWVGGNASSPGVPGSPKAAGHGNPGAAGGGIRSDGSLTIADSIVTANQAGAGGNGGTAVAQGGFSGSDGTDGGMGTGGSGGRGGDGGGIATSGALALTRVTLTGNTTGAGGNGGTGDGGGGGSSNTSSPPGIGGEGRGGHGGDSGGGGGVATLAGVTTIVDSTLRDNAAGLGGTGVEGTGGIGGPSVVGNGGDGGIGRGGFGGRGGAGGAVLVSAGTLEIARSFIVGGLAGNGGTAGNGQGERGGSTPATGGTGGRGGQAVSGVGGSGGAGGAVAVILNGAATITSSSLVGSRSGSGGAGAAAKGGSGGNGPDGTGGAGGAAVSPSGGNAGQGGALGGLDGSGQLLSSTIAGNLLGTGGATGSAVGGAGGNGGVPGAPGAAEVATPPSPPEGGAVRVYGSTSTVSVRNTVLDGNAAPACGFVAPADGGHNLVFPSAGGCPGAVLHPLLAPAADNGGPTPTLRPSAGSPAIDGGAGCAATDQRSVARPQGAACDIGAYEWAPPSVTTGEPSGVTAAAATLTGEVNPNARATTWHIEYGPTTAYGTATPDVAVPAGTAGVPISVPVADLAAATTYHVRLVASNADGLAVTADRTFTTAAPGGSGGPGGVPGGGPGTTTADLVAPRFTAASLRPTAFAVVPVPRRTLRVAAGSTLRFTLSEAARVVVTVERALAGRRVGTSCRKPTRANRGRRACTRYAGARRLTIAGRSGANSVRLTGRIGGRALTRASYRARLVATDAAGNRSAPRDLRFRILRAR